MSNSVPKSTPNQPDKHLNGKPNSMGRAGETPAEFGWDVGRGGDERRGNGFWSKQCDRSALLLQTKEQEICSHRRSELARYAAVTVTA
jgi:hypothetical protein